MHHHERLVSVLVGVTVEFDTEEAIDEAKAARIAQALAVCVVSDKAFAETLPFGVAEEIDGVDTVPTDVRSSITEVNDEGEWS